MNVSHITSQSILGLSAIFFLTAAQAGAPVLNFKLNESPVINLDTTGTATVSYTITNNSKKPHRLALSSTPTGIVNSSGLCVVVGKTQANPNPTCTLTLSINGSALPSNHLTWAPTLCEANPNGTPNANECFEPCHDKLDITRTITPVSFLAAGTYTTNGTKYPMLAQSVDRGNLWSYKIDSTVSSLPVDYYGSGDFRSTNCSGNLCVAVGYYFDGLINYPMLAMSFDAGKNWNYKIEKGSNLPINISSGIFFDTSCSGTICTAFGNYFSAGVQYPMLAQSIDGGSHWTYKIDENTNLPNNFGGSVDSNGTSCSGNTCVAVGKYSDGVTNYPMLAVSVDGGGVWSYKVDKVTNLPNSFGSNGSFSQVSCSGNTCVAGGQYSIGGSSYPVLIQSVDGGNHWSYIVDNVNNLPNDYVNLGAFYSVSCSGNICIAAGDYLSATNYSLMIAVSKDGGNSWSYKVDNTSAVPYEYSSGHFLATSCSGNTCVAGGYYSSGSPYYPMLAVSLNGGDSWSYKLDKTLLPNDYVTTGSGFTSITCSGSACIAAGEYGIGGGSYKPMLANSLDGGNSWTYKIDNTTPVNLPSDINGNGMFNGTSN